jgi:hypothetical protein
MTRDQDEELAVSDRIIRDANQIDVEITKAGAQTDVALPDLRLTLPIGTTAAGPTDLQRAPA